MMMRIIATTTSSTLSFLFLVLLLSLQGTFSQDADLLCVNGTTNEISLNGTEVNPNFEFQPLPEPLNGCDQGYCYCKIVGGNTVDHLCPWQLDDFPSTDGGEYYDSRGKSSSTFSPEDDVGDEGSLEQNVNNMTICRGETTGLGSGDNGITPAPVVTRCGTFIYIQPINADNYYAKGSDIVDCPTTWADVEKVDDDQSGAAESSTIVFLFNNNKASFFVGLGLGVVATLQLL